MSRSFLRSSRARMTALALGVGVVGSLAMAPAGLAATGTPLAGANCQSSDGKISGRGSTLQTYAQAALTAAFASDVCGYVPAMTGAQATADGFPGAVSGTGNGGGGESAGTQAVDPTDSSDPTFPTGNGLAQATFSGNWMVSYNYPSAYGSGGNGSTAGRAAISCRTDAFAGTDIPYVTADYTALNGAPGGFSVEKGAAPTGGSNTDCIPTSAGWTETPPFTPSADTGVYTNDTGGTVMSFPIAVSAIALVANLNGISGCPQPGSNPALSTSDVLNLLGGNITNWDQISDEGSTYSSCNQSVSRVVRSDTSGTTQGLFNYLNDANNGGQTGTPVSTCESSITFASMQAENVSSGADHTWPAGGSCSTLTQTQPSGGPALLTQLEGEPGGVGYADISDADNDPNSGILTTFEVENASGAYVQPATAKQANCSTANDSNLPSGTGWVGIGGTWALNYGGGTSGYDDVSFANQGTGDYPVCSLTWDFVYEGVDGNTAIPTTTVNGGGQTTSGTTLTVASTTGFPATGAGRELTISCGGGAAESAIATYTGESGGDEFTGLHYQAAPVGGACTIPNGATVQKYGVNPEAYLTADQRRTLYSYFTYIFTDAGQASLTTAGYAALPESWLTNLRTFFQQEF